MTTAQSTDLIERRPANGALTADNQPPEFMRGFEGAGVAPFPDSVRAELAKPVDPEIVEIKPDGIPYVPGVEWRRALTRAFGAGGWAIVPRAPARTMGNIVTYHGALVCHGRFVAEAVGEAKYVASNGNSSFATALDGAKTDAVGRCCKDLCLYSELWNPPWLNTFKATMCERYQGNDGKERWRRKDHRTRRPPDALDLISGAGAMAPEPAPSAPASPTPATPADAGGAGLSPASQRAADAAAAPNGSPGEFAADTGEPASAEEIAAVAAQFKRLKWTRGYVAIWAKELFGVSYTGLSKQEAATALALLMAIEAGKKPNECPAYAALSVRFMAEGKLL